MTDQLDLFAELDAAADQQRTLDLQRALPPTLYADTDVRGVLARNARYRQWRDAHGNFDALALSHAWCSGIGMFEPTEHTVGCRPDYLVAELRCHHNTPFNPPCFCVGDMMYRGACTGCDWEGPPHGGGYAEALAAGDAHDHAWPGWRDLPVVPRVPASSTGSHDLSGSKITKQQQAWLDEVLPQYPPGWLEAGGPIRTKRSEFGGRDVPSYAPFGGYDMNAHRPLNPAVPVDLDLLRPL